MQKKDTLAKWLNRIGIIIMVCLVLLCLPVVIPKLMGYGLYEVATGSMEPEFPVGSILYVKDALPSEVEVGDAITYTMGTDTNKVMTHRVIDINEEEAYFITKGDANEVVDMDPISFDRLIGKPVFCLKGMAVVVNFIHSKTGILTIGTLFLLVILLWSVADSRKKADKK